MVITIWFGKIKKGHKNINKGKIINTVKTLKSKTSLTPCRIIYRYLTHKIYSLLTLLLEYHKTLTRYEKIG